ncbi:hypothetical protein ACFFQW_44550 [Umezawaea endophytica]|uniref:Uncharacterized protein n=1 Tax=Umezawaea endophytica TaxID=1654476 RepID=A0A9X3AK25_9PSEU|nr:hypothetical protein [Umezawaea endophytica]MCS7484846.1 hypothetical protein [Umezawaea endophytica]
MTEAADPRAGAGNAAGKHQLNVFSELYRSGFVLVVHDAGLACTQLAHAVVKQCEQQGVRCERWSIEQVDDLTKLAIFTGLILVLPVPTGEADDEVRTSFGVVYAAYREYRPEGLTSVLTAKEHWWFAGPVHTLLFGRGTDDVNPFPAHKKPCVVRHVSDPASLESIFDDYQPLPLPAGFDPLEALVAEGIANWQAARSWRVSTFAEAEAIYKIIKEQIKDWNDDNFPTTSKPLKHVGGNRLELVLRDPKMILPDDEIDFAGLTGEAKADKRAQARKVFKESGAMVVRKATEAIQASYPHVVRPGVNPNAKGKQVAFQKLYKALLYLHGLPAEVRDRIIEP